MPERERAGRRAYRTALGGSAYGRRAGMNRAGVRSELRILACRMGNEPARPAQGTAAIHSRAVRSSRPAPGVQPGVRAIRTRLRQLADPAIAAQARRFFKTGPGQYGERDRFLGIRVPALRALAREYRAASEKTVLSLLRSALHEERLLALIMLVDRYRRSGERDRARIHALYVEHMRYVNNWDLVDGSASEILGAHLDNRDVGPLYALARSRNLWERRIAIIATLRFIRRGSFEHTLAIAEALLDDREDLIHKAVGWMLREVGNRDRTAAEQFLRKHYRTMPRTMLRYAIEKLPESRRKAYLNGTVRGGYTRRRRPD